MSGDEYDDVRPSRILAKVASRIDNSDLGRGRRRSDESSYVRCTSFTGVLIKNLNVAVAAGTLLPLRPTKYVSANSHI